MNVFLIEYLLKELTFVAIFHVGVKLDWFHVQLKHTKPFRNNMESCQSSSEYIFATKSMKLCHIGLNHEPTQNRKLNASYWKEIAICKPQNIMLCVYSNLFAH